MTKAAGRIITEPDDGRYRLLVDAITDYAIYMLDADGTVASWNAGAERFKGYAAAEIIGQHFSRFYTDEDRAAGLPATALRTAAEEGRFEKEGWRVRKDGARFWAHVVIDAIHDEDGQVIGFAKITRDLTERKRAETALIESERQFRLLVQGVTDYAIYMLDPTGRVSSWNAGAERIKGYQPHEIIGQHFSRFHTDEDRAASAPSHSLAVASREGRFEKEGWRVRKDGTRFWAHVIIDAIHDDDGQVIAFAKITRDITERREAQRALEQAQHVLLQSQKLESIGQLTGGIAHDFNNLLMAILGSLELMRKRLPDDPKLIALLDNAKLGVDRGSALTQRMLAFARRQDLVTCPVDLAELVAGITDLLERSIGPSIRIRTKVPRNLPRARTDANQMEAALLNLAVNARDAMPNGGEITISAASERVENREGTGLPAGDYLRLSFADTGGGMDATTLARAAEPFFTTKGLGKGTGLGLSMVHGIAEQSGGQLRLSSIPGVGTIADIWLPVATPDDVAPIVNATATDSPAAPPPMVVLAVDDDALVLLNTVAMLEDMGHGAIGAVSGAEALEVLERVGGVDLIITDQAMPGMTGLQLASQINARWPDIPIVLATGYAELPAGTEHQLPRLPKPFTQFDLSEAVAAAARREPACR